MRFLLLFLVVLVLSITLDCGICCRNYVMPFSIIDLPAHRFTSYTKKFNKKYGEEEYGIRKRNFEENFREISRLNALHGSNVFGLTEFSDMSKEEFHRTMLSGYHLTMSNGAIPYCEDEIRPKCPLGYSETNSFSQRKRQAPKDFYSYPLKFDWRDKNVIGKVITQKKCNACWAFSIVGVMESMSAIRGNGLIELSIQELIDCSKFNDGCEYGNVVLALKYVCVQNLPIVTNKQYPLKLVTQNKCMYDQHTMPGGVQIANYTSRCDIDEHEVLETISNHGPVTALVNAASWMNYVDGIIRFSCGGKWSELNHVIQIVGYDMTGPVPYYIIRNSWGKRFGDNGYLKLEIFKNTCGIASNIVYLDVK